MGKRIVTGVVATVLMLTVLLCGGVIGMVAALAVLAAVAAFELLRAAGFGWGDRVPAMVLAVACPLLWLLAPWSAVAAGAIYVLLLVVESVLRHETHPLERVSLQLFLSLVAAGGFTAMAALRAAEPDGLLYVCVAMVIPWLSDTGAYFTGVLCGRHKLCPVISPKKTVEGLIGGMVTSLLATGLTGWLYSLWCGHAVEIHWVSLLVVAAVGAPLSVVGDLFASVVKRRFGVKDYGNIMPGHGGIMDRFDSVLPVAVLLLLWMQVWPIAGTYIACGV